MPRRGDAEDGEDFRWGPWDFVYFWVSILSMRYDSGELLAPDLRAWPLAGMRWPNSVMRVDEFFAE